MWKDLQFNATFFNQLFPKLWKSEFVPEINQNFPDRYSSISIVRIMIHFDNNEVKSDHLPSNIAVH